MGMEGAKGRRKGGGRKSAKQTKHKPRGGEVGIIRNIGGIRENNIGGEW